MACIRGGFSMRHGMILQHLENLDMFQNLKITNSLHMHVQATVNFAINLRFKIQIQSKDASKLLNDCPCWELIM